MDVEADGLPVEGEPLPDKAVPLGALTCLKVMLPNGQITYEIRTTGDLTLPETLGMAHHAVLLVSKTLMGE